MKTKVALAVAAALSMAGTAQAAWTDISFEDASLSGWSASGNGATDSRVATVFDSTYGNWMEQFVTSGANGSHSIEQNGGSALGSQYKLSYQFTTADTSGDWFAIQGIKLGSTTLTDIVAQWNSSSGAKSGTVDISGYTDLKVTLHGDNDGSVSTLKFDVSPVPEPGEWAMILAGLGLVGVMARRRSLNG